MRIRRPHAPARIGHDDGKGRAIVGPSNCDGIKNARRPGNIFPVPLPLIGQRWSALGSDGPSDAMTETDADRARGPDDRGRLAIIIENRDRSFIKAREQIDIIYSPAAAAAFRPKTINPEFER